MMIIRGRTIVEHVMCRMRTAETICRVVIYYSATLYGAINMIRQSRLTGSSKCRRRVTYPLPGVM
jgi:hypothetical protein